MLASRQVDCVLRCTPDLVIFEVVEGRWAAQAAVVVQKELRLPSSVLEAVAS